ncbi:MAG: ribonuclease HI family protein [Candidatus Kerfeldbacteria bacterium]|nr:ribonuclease HI family protein [Candidatus Kerfeldbacteria bacterium]
MRVRAFTDGGARGNPGPAGIGGVVYDMEGNVLAEVSEFIGHTTNNQAEYRALIETLKAAKACGATEVECYMDSQLVAKQMSREYKVKDLNLQKVFIEAYNLVQEFKSISFTHVYREKNKAADALVNKAIDAAIK